MNERNTRCPITCEQITDPVYIVGDPTGTRFERSAITAWLSSHNNNPITRSYCTTSYLRSDEELSRFISEHSETRTTDLAGSN